MKKLITKFFLFLCVNILGMSELAAKVATSGLAVLYAQVKTSSGNNSDQGPEFLDPLCACVKIAILEYKPLDTKVSIHSHRIHHQDPSWHQGVLRGFSGVVRDQLTQLHLPILYVRGLELGFIIPDSGSPNIEHLHYIT